MSPDKATAPHSVLTVQFHVLSDSCRHVTTSFKKKKKRKALKDRPLRLEQALCRPSCKTCGESGLLCIGGQPVPSIPSLCVPMVSCSRFTFPFCWCFFLSLLTFLSFLYLLFVLCYRPAFSKLRGPCVYVLKSMQSSMPLSLPSFLYCCAVLFFFFFHTRHEYANFGASSQTCNLEALFIFLLRFRFCSLRSPT